MPDSTAAGIITSIAASIAVVGGAWVTIDTRRAARRRELADEARAAAETERAAKIQAKLDAQNAVAAEHGEQIGVVRELVDGNLTAQKVVTRDSHRREVIALSEVIELRRAMGQTPSPEALAEVSRLRTRLAELDAEIVERHLRDEIAAQTPPSESTAPPVTHTG